MNRRRRPFQYAGRRRSCGIARLFGELGKYGEHGVNIGSGALAAYAYRSGYQLGQGAAYEDAKPAATRKRGAQATPARIASPASVSTGWDGQGQTYTPLPAAPLVSQSSLAAELSLQRASAPTRFPRPELRESAERRRWKEGASMKRRASR